MLITLDTNILYQALKSTKGASYLILQKVRDRQIQIALSIPLFNEYEDVLKRVNSLKDFGLEIADIDKFLRFLAYVGKPFETYYLFCPNLKDENDNMLVELAVTSQSKYLMTSNVKDFQNAELKFDHLHVVTPSEFLKIWRSKDVEY